jgi:hypothetical protein
MSSLTVSNPAASAKSLSSTVAIPVPAPVPAFKVALTCPSDYTNDDYNWGTDRYSSPLPAPSSPTPFKTKDEVNAIKVDSEAEDVKPGKTADAELGV